MILGAIAIFMIDHRFKAAAAYAAIGGGLALFGFIHSEAISITMDGIVAHIPIAAGYLLLAAMCFGYTYMYKPELEEVSVPAPG